MIENQKKIEKKMIVLTSSKALTDDCFNAPINR